MKIRIDGCAFWLLLAFVICDPTYINANLGMRMPQVEKAVPQVIKIGLSELSPE